MPIRRCSGLQTRNRPPNDQKAWPPRFVSGSWSSSSTRRPARASSAVAVSPASPAPTTIASASIWSSNQATAAPSPPGRVVAIASAGARFRTRRLEAAQIRELFGGLELVDPGVVLVADWHPDPGTQRVQDHPVLGLAAAGVASKA